MTDSPVLSVSVMITTPDIGGGGLQDPPFGEGLLYLVRMEGQTHGSSAFTGAPMERMTTKPVAEQGDRLTGHAVGIAVPIVGLEIGSY